MNSSMRKYYIAMAVLAIVGVVAVIWQYTISRGAVNDQQTTNDVVELQSKVDDYYQKEGDLPANLNELELDDDLAANVSKYEYSTDNDTYTICASFKTDVSGGEDFGDDSSPYFHKKGRQCFTQEVYSYDFDDYNPDSLDQYYDPETGEYDFSTPSTPESESLPQ